MPMTRAALRAAEAVEETFDTLAIETSTPEPRKSRKTRSRAEIHEDRDEESSEDGHLEEEPGRAALRDVTDENYPQADGYEEQAEEVEAEQEDEPEIRKSTRRATKSKSRSRSKKTESSAAVEHRVIQEPEAQVEEIEVDEPKRQELVPEVGLELEAEAEDPIEELQSELHELQAESEPQPLQEDLQSPETVLPEEQSEVIEDSTPELAPKTPKFDPAIHISPGEEVKAVAIEEDSFIPAIRSRSPAKSVELSRSYTSDSLHSTLQPQQSLRRTSSTSFEQSFEAMDSLEDSIESITAGLPILPAEDMNSPDSPVKMQIRRLNAQGTATPNSSAARTPVLSAKLQSVLRAQEKDKENTPPPAARTPMSKAKTPLKPKTPVFRETPLKSKTPITKPSSPLKSQVMPATRRLSPSKGALSVRKFDTAVSTTPKQPPPSVRRAPMSVRKSVAIASPLKRMESALSTSSSSLRKSSPKKPLANTTNTKSEVLPKKPNMTANFQKTHGASMSFSNSPAKSQPNMHKRRITSGGVLSTAKPGFIPAKSSKPPTSSTFKLPGEIIAEKLKAQKEARQEQTNQPRLTVAEQKAAKLKAEREAREARVRENQLKETEAATTFILPGDAIAEKLRAGREARLAKMNEPKVSLAEQKAAKLKAEREAREERVRQNQLKETEVSVLPGDAVAEKLRAQREVRVASGTIPASVLAEQKAAKLRVEREAREERVRLNQLKAEEEAARKKSARPVNSSTLTISKARAEAAERGRQASKEWAEKMLKKKMGDTKVEQTAISC